MQRNILSKFSNIHFPSPDPTRLDYVVRVLYCIIFSVKTKLKKLSILFWQVNYGLRELCCIMLKTWMVLGVILRILDL